MGSKCKQCGDDSDLMVAIGRHEVCGKCIRKNYLKAVRRGK
jgi:hypothetical protein